jgi:hypothetical protein
MAGHGPFGRVLPLRIDAVGLPPILAATQAIDATDRDAARAADALLRVVGMSLFIACPGRSGRPRSPVPS